MRALLLIDLQNDFAPGGALAVREGDQVVSVANRLIKEKNHLFDFIVATQDWHPKNHKSFASQNSGSKPGELRELGGLPQIMWPDHCVQQTKGAEFIPGLQMSQVDKIVQKGTDAQIDSYSGFYDNGHRKATELKEYLKSKNVDEVIVLGLATDYCVKFTALDARQLGLKTTLIRDGSRAVNLQPGDEAQAIEEMTKVGVKVMTSEEFLMNKKV